MGREGERAGGEAGTPGRGTASVGEAVSMVRVASVDDKVRSRLRLRSRGDAIGGVAPGGEPGV